MPLRNGRLTGLERMFIKAMSTPKTIEQAAIEAGYKNKQSGYAAMANQIVRDAVRTATLKFLHEKYGPAAVHEVANMAFDTTQPSGTRLKALTTLAEWSGIGKEDADDDARQDHELSAEELRARIARLERQREAVLKAASDAARPVIEMGAEPEGDVFG